VVVREDQTVNIIGTFHMVVKINKGVDVDELLRKNTEYIADPMNNDGVVIVIHPKSFTLLEQGVHTLISDEEVVIEEDNVKANPQVIYVEPNTVKECRTCGSKTCGMLAGSCANWTPRI